MPTVNGYSIVVGIGLEPFRLHHILLDAGDQPFSTFSLTLDDQMVLPERGSTVAVSIHGHRIQFDAGSGIDLVDQLCSRQGAVQTVGQALCESGTYMNSCPVFICTNRQIIGCYPKFGDNGFPGDCIGLFCFDTNESAKKIGYVSSKNQCFGQRIALLPVIGGSDVIIFRSGHFVRLWPGLTKRSAGANEYEYDRRKTKHVAIESRKFKVKGLR